MVANSGEPFFYVVLKYFLFSQTCILNGLMHWQPKIFDFSKNRQTQKYKQMTKQAVNHAYCITWPMRQRTGRKHVLLQN